MKDIKHFMLPEHINSLYRKEASSSISLTKEVANKINELVDAYNELSKTNLAKIQEQDGRIRKGILYLEDNLQNTINDILAITDFEKLVPDDVKEAIHKRANQLQLQVNALSSGSPLPATSIEKMTDKNRLYVNTADGNLYYFDGTKWSIIQKYQAMQINNNEITSAKRTVLGDYGFLFSEAGAIVVNLDELTINLKADFVLIYRDKTITIAAQTVNIPSKEPYILYYDTVEKQFVFHRPSNAYHKANENCVFLGYIATSSDKYTMINTTKYDVVLNGKPYSYVGGSRIENTYSPDLLSGKVAIDTTNKQIVFTNAVYSLGNRYVTINNTINYEEGSLGRIKYVCYDVTTNEVIVYETRGSSSINEILLFSFYNNKIYHTYSNKHLYSINGLTVSDDTNKLKNKTACFIGDSITRGAGSSIPFTTYLAEETRINC